MIPLRRRPGRAPAPGKKPQQVIERRFRIGRVVLDYHCTLYRAGLRLDIATDQGEWLRARVRLKAPVAVHVAERIVRTRAERRFAPWALDLLHVSFQAAASGHPDYLASDEDPFARAFAFAWRASGVVACQGDDPAEPELEELRLLLGTAARAAVARCPPAAFAIARRFHPLARLFLYREIACDPTGRIAQVARACPGALVFAAGLESCGGIAGEASRSLVEEVVKGRPLAGVLSRAVGQFLIHEGVEEERRSSGAGVGEALRLIDGSAEGLQAWVDRMRLFVRRAGPRVDPLNLCERPPPHFAPEDVPVEVRANARWYAAMRVGGLVFGRDVPVGLWSFLSRNALPLRQAALVQAEEP